MKIQSFTAIVYQEDDMYIAECPEVGTVDQGEKIERASNCWGMLKVEDREDCIYVCDIQIDRAYRRKGIGTQLIKTAIESAILANKPIRLRVLKGNPAKDLYLRLGFREIQALDNCYMLERS
jgi:ribosomal protein S18 acetylase RimI-like enzyme